MMRPSYSARQLPRLLARNKAPSRNFLRRAAPVNTRAALNNNLRIGHLAQASGKYHQRRQAFLYAGAISGIIGIIYTSLKLRDQLAEQKIQPQRGGLQADSGLPATDPIRDGDRKVVIHDDEAGDLVPTGYPIVPTFPRILNLPNFDTPSTSEPSPHISNEQSATSQVLVPATPPAQADVDYTLVGLGMRTVTFFGINVYLVGFYIATADIADLQSRLVKKINPIASTLVATEKDDLRNKLLDPAQGEELWEELLRSGIPARSAFRVVPVRDTDFPHLRDGFVRAIQARADKTSNDDPRFGESVKDFRALFTRGKLHAQKELLMARDAEGAMTVIINQSKRRGFEDRQLVGRIEDERISRALWVNYLAGKKVASEPARKNIVDGLIEFIERPIGTVAAQVV